MMLENVSRWSRESSLAFFVQLQSRDAEFGRSLTRRDDSFDWGDALVDVAAGVEVPRMLSD